MRLDQAARSVFLTEFVREKFERHAQANMAAELEWHLTYSK